MQFLEDVRVPCDACGGTRYRDEARRVRLDGRSIVEILELTLEEAAARFAGIARSPGACEPFLRVGLGYLTLAQPLSTLSGGELQRMRLALALAEGEPGCLYVLDEPTTGLHPAEVEALVRTLDALLESAAGVIVVEHNLDLIRQADHVSIWAPREAPRGVGSSQRGARSRWPAAPPRTRGPPCAHSGPASPRAASEKGSRARSFGRGLPIGRSVKQSGEAGSQDGRSAQGIASLERAAAELAGDFARVGAAGILAVDASALASIGRRYGGAPHQEVLARLAAFVRDKVAPHLAPADRICVGEMGRDEVLVLFLRDRHDAQFYRETLPGLAREVCVALLAQAGRIAYPYAADATILHAGVSPILHDPTLRPDTLLRRGRDLAIADAALRAQVDAAARRERFLSLLFSEDVRIVFEPIVKLESRQILGYEALVRGAPGSEFATPAQLFAAAAECDALFELDCLCRRTALKVADRLPEGRQAVPQLPAERHPRPGAARTRRCATCSRATSCARATSCSRSRSGSRSTTSRCSARSATTTPRSASRSPSTTSASATRASRR